MSDNTTLIEEAARSENEWVRARILEQDPPAAGSLLPLCRESHFIDARKALIARPSSEEPRIRSLVREGRPR
jgi:hypothetical protein